MSSADKLIEPEVEALGDYMQKRGLDPKGYEAVLVSTCLRWFMGELGIFGDGALAASVKKAFVNQALFIASSLNGKAEVSEHENR